jgi:dTMP kinase
MTEVRFYGYGLPGFKKKRLPGKLIVFEGTDGVGRSTQIALLREWLESEGYAVAATGLKRGKLAGKAIKFAMQGHTLGDATMNLSYATDFADRLERDIIPALRASFVVLIDRYIFSLIARAQVRGADPTWIRNVLGFAMVPDIIFYLQADVSNLVPRVLNARGFDYWESGVDFLKGRDYYDSYVEYQTRLIAQFDAMVDEFNFVRIDASRSILEVFQSLQANIKDQIKGMKPPKRRKVKKVDDVVVEGKAKDKGEKASKKGKITISEKKDGREKEKREVILQEQEKRGEDDPKAKKKDNEVGKDIKKAESEKSDKEIKS